MFSGFPETVCQVTLWGSYAQNLGMLVQAQGTLGRRTRLIVD